MRITQVSYGRTFNTGNYTSERYDLSATVDEGEDHAVVMLDLCERVHLMGGDRVAASNARARKIEIEAEDA